MRCDLLLLNFSNYPKNPIYPYAFVQVAAVARQHGLRVETFDYLGVPATDIEAHTRRLIQSLRPRAIGIHLRQSDSVISLEYWPRNNNDSLQDYFPVEDTKQLIRTIRGITDAPIVLGGVGFSTHAELLMPELRPDLGIRGEADDFFRNFDSSIEGRGLENVANLLWFDGQSLRENARKFFDPLDDREYTEKQLREAQGFYGRELYRKDFAVELSRGCFYRCYFCTEPLVKGRAVRERDLDAVMEDVDFIRSTIGAQSFWLVCSELNMGNSDLARRVAERFIRLREETNSEVRWSAYMLPRWIAESDNELLLRSGYSAGWNAFPSLDDKNLKDCKVPYRSQHAIDALKRQVRDSPNGNGEFLLGNAYSSPEVIRNTVRRLNEEGLATKLPTTFLEPSTRMFTFQGQDIAPRQGELVTIRRKGRSSVADVRYPTFFYAQSLLDALGSTEEIATFFLWLQSTLLSLEYETECDWSRLFSEFSTSKDLRSLLEQASRAPLEEVEESDLDDAGRDYYSYFLQCIESPDQELLKPLFVGGDLHNALNHTLGYLLAQHLALSHPAAFEAFGKKFGLRTDGAWFEESAFEAHRALYGWGSSLSQLEQRIDKQSSLERVYFGYLQIGYNLRLRTDYQGILFPETISPR